MYDIVFAIIKTKTIPCRMFMTITGIEILVRVTSKITQSFNLIFKNQTGLTPSGYRKQVKGEPKGQNL